MEFVNLAGVCKGEICRKCVFRTLPVTQHLYPSDSRAPVLGPRFAINLVGLENQALRTGCLYALMLGLDGCAAKCAAGLVPYKSSKPPS